jgi:alanine dehydrogenase
LKIAKLGFVEAVKVDPELARGVNTYKGNIVHEVVAGSLDCEYVPLEKLL